MVYTHEQKYIYLLYGYNFTKNKVKFKKVSTNKTNILL